MTTAAASRFPIRFDGWSRALSLMVLIPPAACFVALCGEDVTVHMAWAFRSRFPRSSVSSTQQVEQAPLSRGVHGWAGRWLVNGAGDRLLRIDFSPAQPQRAFVLGWPVALRQLTVSVDDPGALADRLRS